jgi:hypothetical protein
VRCSRRRVVVIGLLDAEYRLSSVVGGSLTVRSPRGVLAASVCLLGVPIAYYFSSLLAAVPKSSYILCSGSGFFSQHSLCSISRHRDGYLGSAVYRLAL